MEKLVKKIREMEDGGVLNIYTKNIHCVYYLLYYIKKELSLGWSFFSSLEKKKTPFNHKKSFISKDIHRRFLRSFVRSLVIIFKKKHL